MKNIKTYFLLLMFVSSISTAAAQDLRWVATFSTGISKSQILSYHTNGFQQVYKSNAGISFNYGGALEWKLSEKIYLSLGLSNVNFRETEFTKSYQLTTNSSGTLLYYEEVTNHAKIKSSYFGIPLIGKLKFGKVSFNLGVQQLYLLYTSRKNDISSPFFEEETRVGDSDFGFILGFDYYLNGNLSINSNYYTGRFDNWYSIKRNRQLSLGINYYL